MSKLEDPATSPARARRSTLLSRSALTILPSQTTRGHASPYVARTLRTGAYRNTITFVDRRSPLLFAIVRNSRPSYETRTELLPSSSRVSTTLPLSPTSAPSPSNRRTPFRPLRRLVESNGLESTHPHIPRLHLSNATFNLTTSYLVLSALITLLQIT